MVRFPLALAVVCACSQPHADGTPADGSRTDSEATASRWSWAIRIGGPDRDGISAIAPGPERGIYLAGSFSETATFPSLAPTPTKTLATLTSGTEGFVARYEPDGTIAWVSRSFGNPGAIAVHGDGTIRIAGVFFGSMTVGSETLIARGKDIIVASLDPTGAPTWVTQAGGDDEDQANGMVVAGDGSTYVVGSFVTTATFGSIVLDASPGWHSFLAKLDVTGAFVWAKQLVTGSHSEGYAIVITHDGAVCVAGYDYGGTGDFGSGPIYTPGGPFVAEYDTDGSLRWVTHVQGFGIPTALASSTENVFVTGNFYDTLSFDTTSLTSNGGSDVFLARLGATGQVQLVIREGGTNHDYPTSLVVANDGSALLGGHFLGSTTIGGTDLTDDGYHDLFLARYDPELAAQSVTRAGGVGYASAYGLLLASPDNARNAYVIGTFGGVATFGDTSLYAQGSQALMLGDGYLAKYSDQ